MSKTVAFHNLGCKVNAYELEAMQQILEKAGYQVVPFAPGPMSILLIPVRSQTLQTGNPDRCCTGQRR